MSASATEAALPRADGMEGGSRFGLRDASLKGLSPAFWFLLLYLFVGLSMVDEEWPALGALRPRLILGSLLLLTVVVKILGAATRSRRGLLPKDAVTAWWGAYVVATLLATLWAFDFSAALEHVLDARFPALFCFALIVALVRTRREFLVVVLLFGVAHGVYVVRAFQEYFNGRYVYTMGVIRMVGPGQTNADPNSYAATLAFTTPLVLWAGIHTRSLVIRLGSGIYFLLAGWGVLLSRSRAGVILLGLTVLWLLAALPSGKARAWGVVILIVLVGAGSTQLSDSALRRYKGMLTGGSTASEKESAEGRIQGYQVAWRIFQENRLLGVGPGNWPIYRERRVDGLTMLPHNLTGQLLATLGILGTIAFVGYLLSALRLGWRERWARRGSAVPWARAVRSFEGAMLFTLFLHLVSGLAAHNLERWSWYWVPALMLVAAACRDSAPWSTEA